MLSETLSAGLERYRIGEKVRALRLRKKMGLVQLGQHTGLSAPMLSKIERGQLFPTLPTLLRIALVFGVGLEHFFVEGESRPAITVTRVKDRLRLPDRPDAKQPSYFFESLDFAATERKLEAYRAEFPSDGARSEAHTHEGAELIYVVGGTLRIEVEGEEAVLGEGDAAYFDSGRPHSYERLGDGAAEAVVVTVPERAR